MGSKHKIDIIPRPPSRMDTLASLICDRRYLQPDEYLGDVTRRYFSRDDGYTLPVVENGKPVGILPGWRVIARYAADPEAAGLRVTEIMRPPDPLFRQDLPVVELCRKLRNEPLREESGELIVVDHAGNYTGRIRIARLLGKVADLQLQYARYANPLTQLPGNVPINKRIDALLERSALFVVACCDIDQFKPYNDVYGYARGDEVILYFADLLQQHIDPELDFVGHVGGDNLTVIFQSPDWFERCEAMIRQCDQEASRFYSPLHREANGVQTFDRLGRRVFYPVFSLSIGAVPVEPGKFLSHHEVASAAREVKKRAKSTHGSAIYIDERSYRCETTQQPLVRN